MIEWIKEFSGTHRAYMDNKSVAVVQGSGVSGWRYNLDTGEWSDARYRSVVAAKRAAEAALAKAEG